MPEQTLKTQLEETLEAVGADVKRLEQQLQGISSIPSSSEGRGNETASGISPLNPVTLYEGRPNTSFGTIISLSQSVIGHQCLFYWQDASLSGFGFSGSGIYATQHAFTPAFPNKIDFAHSVTAAIVPSDSGLSTVQIAYSLDGRRLRIGRSSGNNYRLLKVEMIS